MVSYAPFAGNMRPVISRTVHGGSMTLTRSPDFNVIVVGLKMG